MKLANHKLAVIVGARPNFMKAAPLLNYLDKANDFQYDFIHSGQHFDAVMTTETLSALGAPLFDIVMEIPTGRSSIRYSRLLRNFKSFFERYKYDAVLVFGDVNTTVAATLAARENLLKVIHVESGLRSHDVSMPEEVNRIITDNYSQLHLCTELAAVNNLIEEGISENSIKLVGNLMIESLLRLSEKIGTTENKLIEIDILVTFHRAENIYSNNLNKFCDFIIELAELKTVVFPMHPATKDQLKEKNIFRKLDTSKVNILPAQNYADFIKLMQSSKMVITDSGGIQEEAVFLNKPIITLRENTERPCTLESGLNILCPINEININKVMNHLNKNKKRKVEIPYWDSLVSERIIKEIRAFLKK